MCVSFSSPPFMPIIGYDLYLLDDTRNAIDKNGNVKRYGGGFAKGDKVSVHLNLVKGQIKYYINDKDQGIAFQDVARKTEVTYRLVVGLFDRDKDTEIEMLEFITF